MSWLYVPAQEASSWDSGRFAHLLASSVTWRGKHIRPESWLRKLRHRPWMKLLSGLTLPPSMVDPGVLLWIVSLQASRVSRTPAPAKDSAKTTSGTSGTTLHASFATRNRPSSSWKTCQGSLLEGWGEYSGPWPTSGSMRNGAVSARPRSALPTLESAFSSLLPIPSAASFGTSQNGQRPDGSTFKQAGKPSLETMARQNLLPTPKVHMRGVQSRSPGDERPELEAMARRGLLPTPTVGDSKASGSRNTAQSSAHTGTSLTDWLNQDGGTGRLLPTPNAGDGRHGGPNSRFKRGNLHLSSQAVRLAEQMEEGERLSLPTPTARDYKGPSARAKRHTGACLPGALGQTSRCLNPRFVEWMMGWPLGWTQITPDATSELVNRVDRLRACGNGVVPHQFVLAVATLKRRLFGEPT